MLLAEKVALVENCKFRKISPFHRLSVTAQGIARGSYLGTDFSHYLSKFTLHCDVDETFRAVEKSVAISFLYRDKSWLKEVFEGFSRDGCSA